MNARSHGKSSAASMVALMALVSGCSSASDRASDRAADRAVPKTVESSVASSTAAPNANERSTSLGQRVDGLDFAVPSTAPETATADRPPDVPAVSPIAAKSASGAVTAFLDHAIAGDFTVAWALLAPTDRARLAGPSALAEQFATGEWRSYKTQESSGAEADVTVDVLQTPRINEIVGLISPTATVTLPTVVEDGSHFVRWTRRIVDQHYPERSEATDTAVRDAVVRWAESRQACAEPANEYANGLLGVVGLGDALCRTSGTKAAEEVGELDALDEPEPIIEGFGGSAIAWARVVTLEGPVPMRVVAAPVGNDWTVIGLARPPLAAS